MTEDEKKEGRFEMDGATCNDDMKKVADKMRNYLESIKEQKTSD